MATRWLASERAIHVPLRSAMSIARSPAGVARGSLHDLVRMEYSRTPSTVEAASTSAVPATSSRRVLAMALDRPPVSGVTPDAAIDCTRPLPSMTRSTSRLDASTARMGPPIENGFDVLKKSVPFWTCCSGATCASYRQSARLEAEQIRAGRGDDRFSRSQPRGNGGQRRVAAPHDVVEERARLSEEQHLVAERDRVAIAFERYRCGRRRVDQSRNRARCEGVRASRCGQDGRRSRPFRHDSSGLLAGERPSHRRLSCPRLRREERYARRAPAVAVIEARRGRAPTDRADRFGGLSLPRVQLVS